MKGNMVSYFIILLIAIITRALIAFAQEGYYDFDSYHYALPCNEKIVFCHVPVFVIVLMNIAFFIALYYIIIYLLDKYRVHKPELYAFVFTMLPMVYMNTAFDSLDKNMATLAFIAIIYCYLHRAATGNVVAWKLIIEMSLIIMIASLFWSVFPFMLLIIAMVYALYSFFISKKYRIGLILLGIVIIIFVLLTWYFPALIPFEKSSKIIAELFPIWKTFPYLEYSMMILAFIFAIRKKTAHLNIMDFLVLITVPMTLIIFRLNIFALIPSYIVFLENFNLKNRFVELFVIIFLVLAIVHASDVYKHKVQDDDIEYLVSVASKDCIVAEFGQGYYLETLTSKAVLFSAHPNKPETFLDHFFSESNCSIIWNNKTMAIAEYWKSALNYYPPGQFAKDNIVQKSGEWMLSE